MADPMSSTIARGMEKLFPTAVDGRKQAAVETETSTSGWDYFSKARAVARSLSTVPTHFSVGRRRATESNLSSEQGLVNGDQNGAFQPDSITTEGCGASYNVHQDDASSSRNKITSNDANNEMPTNVTSNMLSKANAAKTAFTNSLSGLSKPSSSTEKHVNVSDSRLNNSDMHVGNNNNQGVGSCYRVENLYGNYTVINVVEKSAPESEGKVSNDSQLQKELMSLKVFTANELSQKASNLDEVEMEAGNLVKSPSEAIACSSLYRGEAPRRSLSVKPRERVVERTNLGNFVKEPDDPAKWMSEMPYFLALQRHSEVQRSITSGNPGAGLFGTEQYKLWEQSEMSCALWIHGQRGIGKTTLMSALIERAKKFMSNSSGGLRVAFFYCSPTNTSSTVEIIRTILRQLATEADGSVAKEIEKEYLRLKETAAAQPVKKPYKNIKIPDEKAPQQKNATDNQQPKKLSKARLGKILRKDNKSSNTKRTNLLEKSEAPDRDISNTDKNYEEQEGELIIEDTVSPDDQVLDEISSPQDDEMVAESLDAGEPLPDLVEIDSDSDSESLQAISSPTDGLVEHHVAGSSVAEPELIGERAATSITTSTTGSNLAPTEIPNFDSTTHTSSSLHVSKGANQEIRVHRIEEPAKLAIEDCVRLALQMLQRTPAVIVVDALDKCNSRTTFELFETFEKLIDKVATEGIVRKTLKIILTHQEDLDTIRSSFEGKSSLRVDNSNSSFGFIKHCHSILIDKTMVEPDLEDFIEHELQAVIGKGEIDESTIRDQNIKAGVLKEVNGQFEMVRPHIAYISRKGEIGLTQAGRIPGSLVAMHFDALSAIDNLTDEQSLVVKNTLMWMMCCRGQLSAQEIISFATRKRINTEINTPEKLITACFSLNWIALKEVDRLSVTTQVFVFQNESIQEFLERHSDITSNSSNNYVVRECLDAYITEDDEQKMIDQRTGFYSYALEWPFHYKAISKETRRNLGLEAELRKFIGRSEYRLQNPFNTWMHSVRAKCDEFSKKAKKPHTWCDQECDRTDGNLVPAMLYDSITVNSNIWQERWLPLASVFGLTDLFMSMSIHPSAHLYNEKRLTGVHLAAKWGQVDIMRLWLLSIGKDRAVGSIKTAHTNKTLKLSPLYYAIKYGHAEIVRLLLTRGVDDPNACLGNRRFGFVDAVDTPVIVAVRNQQVEVLKLLLSKSNVDINQKFQTLHSEKERGHNYTILALAIKKGSIRMVEEILRRKDAQINGTVEEMRIGTKATFIYSMLGLAIRNNQLPVIQLLLSHQSIKLNYESTSALMFGRTEVVVPPIVAAAMDGKKEVLELLLSRPDLDVNARYLHDSTALAWACSMGNETAVHFLLKHVDVEVNAVDSDGHTALIAAILHRKHRIVEILCKNERVDVNCQSKYTKSAMYYSVAAEDISLVKSLLDRREHGSIRIEGEVLRLAVLQGNEAMVKLLYDQKDLWVDKYDPFYKGGQKVADRAPLFLALNLLLDKKRTPITSFDHLLWYASLTNKDKSLLLLKKSMWTNTPLKWKTTSELKHNDEWMTAQRNLLMDAEKETDSSMNRYNIRLSMKRHFEQYPLLKDKLREALFSDNADVRRRMYELTMTEEYQMRRDGILIAYEASVRADSRASIGEDPSSSASSALVASERPETLRRLSSSGLYSASTHARSHSIMSETTPSIESVGSHEDRLSEYTNGTFSFTEDKDSLLLESPFDQYVGHKVNRQGYVLDMDGIGIARLHEGDIKACMGQKINNQGQVIEESNGQVVGQVKMITGILSPLHGYNVSSAPSSTYPPTTSPPFRKPVPPAASSSNPQDFVGSPYIGPSSPNYVGISPSYDHSSTSYSNTTWSEEHEISKGSPRRKPVGSFGDKVRSFKRNISS